LRDERVRRARLSIAKPHLLGAATPSVTLPARRVRVLATRQADKFRRQNVRDVVHEVAGTKDD